MVRRTFVSALAVSRAIPTRTLRVQVRANFLTGIVQSSTPMHEDASRLWFRQHVAACLREREVQDYTALFSICVWHCVGLILLLAAIAGEGTTE